MSRYSKARPAAQPTIQPLRYTIPEFAKVQGGISHALVYRRIARGEIRVVKDGDRTFITHEESLRYAKTNHPSLTVDPRPRED